MRKKSNETLKEYFAKYWETYKETEECDEKFALNTFKYGLQKDKDGIYNLLTRLPPYTFDDLLSRVNKYARVEDDEMTTASLAEEKKGNVEKFDKSKRKRMEENNKFGEDGYKRVNIVFTKPIYKIIFDIKDQPYFEWPRKIGGDLAKIDANLKCLYHRDHGQRTWKCKILKQLLEKLVG